MTSRDQILKTVRQQHIADVPHPEAFELGIVYDEPMEQFRSVLESVGGRCEAVDSVDAATEVLETLSEYTAAQQVCSCVDGIGRSTVDLSAIDDPHDLKDVDFAIMPGKLAVAENAAIWVTTPDVIHRTLYFLTQHLVIVVPRSRVVSNMHEAYGEITIGGNAFGTWLSGPSKTADIEQSLVKGAHGARTLLVLLLGNSSI